MEYSIEDKLDMSVERLCQEQKADFLNDLSEKAEIIHRSLCSITIKDGSNIYKMYYYDNLGRIKREIVMLQIMEQIPIRLSCDSKGVYYSKVDFLELENISSNDNACTISEQVYDWCEQWNQRHEFAICAKRNWKSEMVPYMIDMLTLYGEDAERYIEYLNGLQEEVFIHGDFTLDNVKKIGEQIVIIDFETASIGPKLWDKTTFVYSLIEHGYIKLGMKLFEEFQCNKQMLECIAAVRLAIARRKENHETAYNFIRNI